MILTIDFETRSKVDLKKVGAYVYAAHESTEVLCLAYMADKHKTYIWTPQTEENIANRATEYLKDQIVWAQTIQAHNMNFERCIWREIMVKKFGFPPLPLEKLECTAAKCSYFALPRSLDRACKALNLPGKDNEGHKLMMRMCKPLPENAVLRKAGHEWLDDGDSLSRLYQYCKQDVEAEYRLAQALPGKLPKRELALWRLDQEINDRGVFVDLPAIRAIEAVVDADVAELQKEVPGLTNSAVERTTQTAKLLAWVNFDQGLELDNLQKDTIEDILPKLKAGKLLKVLQIRLAAGKASVKKLTAMRVRANTDGRVRGGMLYYGAERTGRWAGKGLQLHNLVRDSDPEAPTAFQWMHPDDLRLIYGTIAAGASKAVRPCIRAPEGKELLCGDFSAIEGRVLAWLAGEEKVLQGYRDGLDMYKVAASGAFFTPYEDINKDQRQIGKVIELACGYQGWTGAFAAMGTSYDVEIEEERAAELIGAWRDNRRKTVAFWRGMNDAAIKTVQTGTPHRYGKITFGMCGEWLRMRLPSGRLLAYFEPQVTLETDLYKREKLTLSYMGLKDNQWVRIHTYGGKLVENATQAVARDFLAEAITRVSKIGYIVFHVHDEIVCEIPERLRKEAVEIFDEAMSEVPEWAHGCPVAVESWQGLRYRK